MKTLVCYEYYYPLLTREWIYVFSIHDKLLEKINKFIYTCYEHIFDVIIHQIYKLISYLLI